MKMEDFSKKCKLIAEKEKQIVAVVVTYNRKEMLRECLQALLEVEYKNFRIFVVDNASTDGTREYIKKQLQNDKLSYFNTGANLGGAGGFNFGIKKAVEAGADYIWVMDDDCIVNNDSLQGFVSFMQNYTCDFGFLSSVVKWTDGSICKMNEQKIDLKNRVQDYSKIQKIQLASFVSMFINVKVIEKLGLPIKDFFIWGDDWEFSSRISKVYDCYLVPQSEVVHKCKVNMGCNIAKDESERLDRYFYAYRNEGYMYTKLGFRGKIYFALKKLLHRFRLLKAKNKKQKLAIMKKGVLAIKSFNPSIEYAYRPTTRINVCECFAEPLAYGGQEAFIINMYKNFNNEQINYTFATPFSCTNKNLENLAKSRANKIVAKNYKFNTKLRKYYIKKFFKEFFRENKFDVVHIHSGSVWALLNIAKLAEKNGIKKVIVHSHCTGKLNLKYKVIKFLSDLKIQNYADVFFACSKPAAEFKFPKDIIKNEKFSVINNGIDVKNFSYKKELRNKYRKDLNIENDFVILNVGRFSEEKNHKFMIKIAKKLKERNFEYKFILVGAGELKQQIIDQLKQNNLLNNFILLENRSDVAQIMMASDIFVFPSLYEGLGIVGIEAQTSGLRTLCSYEVPRLVKVTDLCEFLSLDNLDDWIKKIKETKNLQLDRAIYSDLVAEKGYDAKQSAQLLEQKYLE